MRKASVDHTRNDADEQTAAYVTDYHHTNTTINKSDKDKNSNSNNNVTNDLIEQQEVNALLLFMCQSGFITHSAYVKNILQQQTHRNSI